MSLLSEKNKTKNEVNQESAKDVREMSVEELQNVVGAGDPYITRTGAEGKVLENGKTKENGEPIVLPELP